MFAKLLQFVVVTILVGTSNNIYGQVEFLHGLGIGYYNKGQIYKVGDNELTNPITGLALIYNPRLIIASLGDNFSIGASAYPAIGFSSATNIKSGSSSSILVDLPITAEFSFGAGSSSKSHRRIGAYIHGGYGVNLMTNSDVGEGDNQGPILGGGLRLRLGTNKAIGIRGSYMYSICSEFTGTFTLGAFYYFGFK